MFGCIYQLWDWLESPPLFTSATMDAKKLQQLQQANAQKKIPLAYQTNLTDYRTATQSPVFHQQQQAAAYHHMQFVGGGYQQSPTATSSSGGGPLTPIEMQPHANKLLLKHHIGGGGGGGTTSNSSHSSPYHQSYSSGEQQLYQSPNERTYLAAAGRLQSHSSGAHNPATALQTQYQQLQQAKMQLQMQTQSDAMQQQQRTFAMRQALNPPIPQGHYHMSQSSSIMSSVTLQSQLQQQQQTAAAAQHQRAPPSSLNLASQFQPAAGPLKVNPQLKAQQQQQAAHYHQQQHQQQLDQQAYAQQQLQLQLQLQHQHQLQTQQQQRLKNDTQTPGSEQSPVYIQQNHPGHVVNQACQTQISAVKPGGPMVVQKSTPSSEDSSANSKSPTHAPLDRKKSTSSSQALKSPVTKRPTSSPVTLSGWLYKQGSDGLKVWRKRWFVLAEYCLYYYKGPEEEKVLGSILLPSYRVSACSPEDKIYRKFAFKCEHTNMRTYWLAAESAESMIQWVRALTAATMMQAPSSGGESDQMSQPSGSSSLNHSGENSDSGIHTLQSKMSQGQITPASDNGAAGGNAQHGGGSGQPLYANAPPKPRRINDGGYSSPSPEHSIDNERKTQSQLMQHQRKQHLQQQQQLQQQQMQQQQSNSSRRSGIMSPTLQQMQQHQQQRSQQQQPQQHAIYDARTGKVSSTLRLQQKQQQQQQQQEYSVDNLEAKYQKQMTLNATDDFPKSPPGGDMLGNYMEMEEQIMLLQQQKQQQQQQQQKLQSRPDEIYGERELYMQKLIQQRYPGHLGNYPMAMDRRTPDAYGRSKNRIYSDYEDIYNMSQLAGSMGGLTAQEALLQEAASYRRPMSPPSYDGSKHVPAMPSRYTPNMLEPTLNQQTGSSLNLRGRSSSTNLVRPHSADFLEYEARAEAAANSLNPAVANALKTDAIHRAPRPKSSLDINRTSDSYYYSEASYAEKMRKSALYLQHPQGQTAAAGAVAAQPQQAAASYRSAAEINIATNPFGSGLHTIAGYENPYERALNKRAAETMNTTTLGAQSTASMPRMSRATAAANATAGGLQPSASSTHIRSASVHPAISPSKQPPSSTSPSSFYTPAMSTAQIIQQNEQFLRSASARLPKRSGGFDDETRTTSPPGTSTTSGGNGTTPQDGERKREESMKRLLEWKQRMLQSPLTRKGAQGGGSNMSAMAKLGSNPNILLSSTTVASGAHYGPSQAHGIGSAGGNTLVGGVTGIKRSRSETHANAAPTAGYNSYSSDDEASISVQNVRNLPKGNLTVKPDPGDPTSAAYKNYEQTGTLTNTYYGTAQDTKYAKTTILTDRNGVGGGGGGINSINALATSTLHQQNEINDFLLNGDAEAIYGGMHHQNGINGLKMGYTAMQPEQQYTPLMRRAGSRAEIDMLERETSSQIRHLDVSAGDLLSRTHEELVLLLIQLRRHNSNTARAIEQCCTDIHEVQNRLRTAEGLTRAESIQRLDYLKAHLLELERQYEKSKPLVNLVDNMVKLGSLYRNNDAFERQHLRPDAAALDRLEFNQRLQERYLLAEEEQRQWDSVSPSNQELQSKIEQLYKLDQLLQEESGTLQVLQREKEDLENALGGLKARIQDTKDMPIPADLARKQQMLLERELVRVHQLLAENSKKLELTVDGNTRLEQELMVLRQKLQLATSPQETTFLNGVSETYARNTTAMLESELKRVQNLVGDMQRQRQDLTVAVRQLTENSQRLYQEIGNRDHSANGSMKKRHSSACWIETDLDSMRSVNRTMHDSTLNLSMPLYVDTSAGSMSNHIIHSSNTASCRQLNDYTNGTSNRMAPLQRRASTGERPNYHYNDAMEQYDALGHESDCYPETNPFANLTNSEKQEIKTVRIVKRESERRHRDRSERNGLSNSTQNLDQVLEEEQSMAMLAGGYAHTNGGGSGVVPDDYPTTVVRSKSLPRGYNDTPKTSRQHQQQSRHHQNGTISKQNGHHHLQASQKYHDKNSNYSQNGQMNNGHSYAHSNGGGGTRHLNPLANAYFAKQLQQQKHQSQRRDSSQSVLQQKTDSMQSLNKSLTDLSPGPVFQSEAARQIIAEISAGSASEDTEKIVERVPPQHKHRRAVPREKRRHYTAPNDVNMKAMEKVQAENDMNRNNTNWRARDDLDMEVALRPRMNAPDVVRSALGHGEKISENTIDNLLLAPNKIVIPERYIPEKTPELSPEEKKRRQEKVESIKKMLAEAPISTANDAVSLPPSKINAEKKQREHLLQLNQILAQQVMQMSKIVAEKAMSRASHPSSPQQSEFDDERKSESPNDALPIFQQRDNYYS